MLGRSYQQIAREGWGEQKSQNGGANPALSGPATTSYHLWAVTNEAAATTRTASRNGDLFHNPKVNIDTSVAGLASIVKGNPPMWLSTGLRQIDVGLKQLEATRQGRTGAAVAHQLAPIYRQALELRKRVAGSNLDAEGKAGLLFELDAKIDEFQATLKELLGLDLVAFTTKADTAQSGGPFRGGSADEMPRSVTPGEEFKVRVHAGQATAETTLNRVWLESESGDPWKTDVVKGDFGPDAPVADSIFRVRAAENAEPTQPYFTQPSIKQPYYDVSKPEWRLALVCALSAGGVGGVHV